MAECDKCPHEHTIKMLSQRDSEFMEMLERFEKKLDRIAESIAEIKVLEASHAVQKEALARAFAEITKLEIKVEALIAAANERSGATKMFKFMWPIIWAFGGGVITLALMQLKYIFWAMGH